MTRIEQLRQFINDDPSDEFPRYALALEYLHVDPSLAKKEFDDLLSRFPDYLPAYYPAAHLMIDLGENVLAESLFQRGIHLAALQKNLKTEQELKSAYNQWVYDRG
ncbi:MAG: tetratricopeptide repeat protein [Cyclobacteriaceae bacterium]|nr:tetratricopeptide repeat protein [Cyclobacteriaceae bacterium]